MRMNKLESLIPAAGADEVEITVRHSTLGRGTITLLPFAGPEGEDTGFEEGGAPEGMASFRPDNLGEGESEMFLGLIVPRECACGRCLAFALVDNNGGQRSIREEIHKLLLVSPRTWAQA